MDLLSSGVKGDANPGGLAYAKDNSLRHEPPLFVSLDATLLRTDVFFEHVAAALRAYPLQALLALFYIFRGRAAIKQAFGRIGGVSANALPYRRKFRRWLQEQYESGRTIILSTSADRQAAQAVSDHLGIFSAVQASDGQTYNSGLNKLDAILAYTDNGPFDYCGAKHVDLVILAEARHAVIVGTSRSVIQAATREGNADLRFARQDEPHRIRHWIHAARPFHWLKNLLVMVPFFTSFLVTETSALLNAFLAAVAMCFAASAGYLINDLLDMQADRVHPRKRKRPFAAGRLTAAEGMGGAFLLLLLSAAIALWVGPAVLGWIAVYLMGTFSYSVLFKREPIVDVVVLAALHTIRIIVGAVAVSVPLSCWLLAFSIFFFFSLAVMKRCGELIIRRERGEQTTSGRGYRVADLSVLQPAGISAGIAAVLVLALYVHSPLVIERYPMPQALWLALIALLVWTTRAWFDTSRGLMLDDPLLYAVRHRRGRMLLLLVAASFSLASLWGLG
ncbi:MAG: UbiA family prenyltransferase [Burkholderiaceae bacterium]